MTYTSVGLRESDVDDKRSTHTRKTRRQGTPRLPNLGPPEQEDGHLRTMGVALLSLIVRSLLVVTVLA